MQDIYTYTNIKELAQFIDNSKKQESEFKIKDIKIINNTQKFDLSNVLLTGVTGFLGIHLLYELLNKKNVKKIYCIIRAKDFKNANERFQEKIKNYFKQNEKLFNIINEKVVREIINTRGESYKTPWYGQLMTGPQLIAYLIQINIWLEEYNINILDK